MARTTRNRQLIKLAFMQGYHVPIHKWNYQRGTNLPMWESIQLTDEIDKTFSWNRHEVVNYNKGRKTLSNSISFHVKGGAGNLLYYYTGIRIIPVKHGEKYKSAYNHRAEWKHQLQSMEEDLKINNTYDEDEVL
ncbi:hypothetical protein JANET_25 [Bacillus phage Janet]|nr:hypothetical protein JANET_25 [Bacillus phage Janet]